MPKPAQPTPKRRYLYLPDGWDDVWQAAKASGGIAGVQWVGDSFTEGLNASDFMTKSWPAGVRAYLAAANPTYGDFYNAGYSPQCSFTGNGASSSPAFQTTATANIVFSYGNGLAPIAAANGAVAFGATGDLLYTSPYACTSLDLIVYDIVAGTFQFNVDGGVSAGTVSISAGYATPTTGASTWTATMQGWGTSVRISITGLSNGVHTLRIGGASVVNAFWVEGVTCYTGNAGGILYGFNGVGGQTGGFTGAGNNPQFAGKYKTSSGDTTHPTGFGFPAGAHLNIWSFGINDCQTLYPIETYLGQARRTFQAWRRATKNCSILIVANCLIDKDISDVTGTAFGNHYDWPRFLQAMYALARAYNCGLVNFHAKWGETPVADGYLQGTGGNAGHPTDAGYADMAATIYPMVA